YLGLVVLLLHDSLLYGAELSAKLLNAQRIVGVGGGDRRRLRWCRRLCHLGAKLLDLAPNGDDIGIVVGIAGSQFSLLAEKRVQLGLLSLWGYASTGGSRTLGCGLLSEHRLFVALVLLDTRKRLSSRVQLGIEAGQHVHVGPFFAWKPASELLLKAGQLGVLIVQVPLGVGKLSLQKGSRAFGRGSTVTEIFADEERGNLAADKLGGAGVTGLVRDVKTGHSGGTRRLNGFYVDVLADGIDTVIHGHLAGSV